MNDNIQNQYTFSIKGYNIAEYENPVSTNKFLWGVKNI